MRGIIYKATNTLNGKVYIGQTVGSLAHRKGEHLRDSAGDLENVFHTALYQYPDCFEWEVLDTFSGDAEYVIHALNVAEEYQILRHNSTDSRYGYNSTFGGYSSDKFADYIKERKRAINGQSRRVLQYDAEGNFIREFESLNAVSAYLGKEKCHGKVLFAGLHYGYQWRPKGNEYFQRNIGPYQPKKKETKAVLAYDAKGIFFGRFESLSDATNATGVNARSLGNVRNIERHQNNSRPFYFFDDEEKYPDSIIVHIRENAKKNAPIDSRKRVAAYSLDGALLREYPSLSDAARDTNSTTSHIGKFCKKPIPIVLDQRTRGTISWRYVDSEPATSIEVVDLRPKKVEKLVWRLQPDGSKRQVQVTMTETKANEYKRKMKHQIAQYTHDGVFVRTWDNAHQAASSGLESENFIRKSLLGQPTKRKSNFIWRYVDDEPNSLTPQPSQRPNDTIYELDKAGHILATYSDTADAAQKSGFSQSYICNVLAKRIRHPKRKFIREADYPKH